MKMIKEIANGVVQHVTQIWRFKIAGILCRHLLPIFRWSLVLPSAGQADKA